MIIRILTFIYSYYLSYFFKKAGKKMRIHPRLNFFQELKNISIGRNFRSMGFLQLYAENGIVEIGDNCSLNTNVQIGASDGKIIIGNDVLIGPNCVLRSSIHNYQDSNKKINEQGHKKGSIVIGNNVWISSNCVISGNVNIGDGSVIGAGSFVNKNVEQYSLYHGSPAKKVLDKIGEVQ